MASSKSDKGKEVLKPDGINIKDSDNEMFDGDQVNRSIKGKSIDYSSVEFPDHTAKGAIGDNFIGSAVKSSASTSDNTNYTDMFLDDAIPIDDYCQLLLHFDSADIPPGEEEPTPHIPWLFDPVKSDTKSVSRSSADTNYQAANSFASGSLNTPGLAGPGPRSNASDSNNDYSDLYLDASIDIDEYAEFVDHFDKSDIPPGVEKPISHSFLDFGLSSSGKLPQASSSNAKQSDFQHLGTSLNIPVGLAILAQSPRQSQRNNSTANEVSSKEADETIRKFKDFKQFDTVEDHSDHYYSNSSCSTMQKNWAKKIQEEWKILEKDLPDKIFVRVYETRMDLLRAVIVGAEGTPYHNGLFFFDISFPSGYPNVPPLVHYHAHGLRLNPNLYNCGRVCLSLLNTWSGDKKEKWIPGMSTMLQVLVSIQGLILNSEPYFNEPGWAYMKGQPVGVTASKRYNDDTFILSLRTMVYVMKKPPKCFEDFVRGYFRNRAHDILSACEAYRDRALVTSQIKGSVKSNHRHSEEVFNNSLPELLPILVKEFTRLGAEDCEKFLLSIVGSK